MLTFLICQTLGLVERGGETFLRLQMEGAYRDIFVPVDSCDGFVATVCRDEMAEVVRVETTRTAGA